MEYVGSDYEADMEAIAQDPHTREWWALTDLCQERMPTSPDSQWAPMEEVFHHD